MKVVVFTCSTGGGHNACANYIKKEFDSFGIECDVQDYLKLIGDKAANFIEKLYLDTTKGNGNVFGSVYKLGELYSKTNIPSPVYGLNALVKEKMNKFLEENNYDLAIGTHLFPCLALTKLKRERNIKFVNVATDYECIPFWEETNPDLFVIPSFLLKEDFIKKGFKEEILLDTGIPVASDFFNVKEIPELKNKKVILLTSGSMGFGQITNIVKGILKEISDAYLVVICGSNEKLRKELEEIDNPHLLVKGFINNMNDYIAMSKIVISKPGGLTTTEIAAMNKPLIHMMPIPGVEDYNANFFANNRMSLRANSLNEVIECTKKLLKDETLQNELMTNQKKLINKYSAKSMIEYILKHYENLGEIK